MQEEQKCLNILKTYIEKYNNEGLTREEAFEIAKMQKVLEMSWDSFELYENFLEKLRASGVFHEFTEEEIDYIRSQSDIIATIISKSGVDKIVSFHNEKVKAEFKFYTTSHVMKRCDIHSEKTGSLGFSNMLTSKNDHDSYGLFNCFGCGSSGNIFGYLMKTENLSYKEAIKIIAEAFLIEINQGKSRYPHIAKRIRETFLNEEFKEILDARYEHRFNIYGEDQRMVRPLYDKKLLGRVKNGIYDTTLIQPITKKVLVFKRENNSFNY